MLRSTSAGEVTSCSSPLATTSYELCVYDQSSGTPTLQLHATAPAGGTCKGAPCWKVFWPQCHTEGAFRNHNGFGDTKFPFEKDQCPGAQAARSIGLSVGVQRTTGGTVGAGEEGFGRPSRPASRRALRDGGTGGWVRSKRPRSAAGRLGAALGARLPVFGAVDLALRAGTAGDCLRRVRPARRGRDNPAGLRRGARRCRSRVGRIDLARRARPCSAGLGHPLRREGEGDDNSECGKPDWTDHAL